jgi:hypothetical protein
MKKARLVIPVLAAVFALPALAGCGGGGESSSSDLATVAPPKSAVFLEATLRPSGSLKTDVEGLAMKVAGIEDLGTVIVEKLESAASHNQFDYEKNIEPWLGEKAAMALPEYDGDNFSEYVMAFQSTDTGATQEFIDNVAEKSDEPIEDGSYEGVDFKVETGNGSTMGVVGDLLVFAQSEAAFKKAVDASDGESLAESDTYASAVSHAPSGSLVDVYADIGGLIEQAGNEVDPETEKVLETAGIDVKEASLVASLVPGSDNLELDIAGNLGKGAEASPPATELLESMPADSLAALSVTEYGKHLQEGIDNLDATGIPGQVPPHQLKKALKAEGIDIGKLAGSLEEVAAFASGNSKSSLGGAVVLTAKSAAEAKNTVANIGLLLRSNHTPGVTAIGGAAAGFSIHNSSLGRKPLVIAAKGERIAIGYGLPAALEGLTPPSSTLADDATFKEAEQALGDTPISGFVDGPAALDLAEGLVSPLDTGFQEAKPYLGKIQFIGIGGESEGDLSVAKLIVGLKK